MIISLVMTFLLNLESMCMLTLWSWMHGMLTAGIITKVRYNCKEMFLIGYLD